MASGKLHALLLKLYQQTMAGTLVWKESTNNNTFQHDFASYSVLVGASQNRFDGTQHSLKILDAYGDTLETVSGADLNETSSENDHTDYADRLRTLFEAARRQAKGTDKAIDSILEELELDDDNPFRR